MPRATLFLIIFALLIVGVLVFLSTSVEPVPTRTIEQDVSTSADPR